MHGIIKYDAFFLRAYFLKKKSTATSEVKYVFLPSLFFWEWLRALCISEPAKRTRAAQLHNSFSGSLSFYSFLVPTSTW